MSRTGHRLLRPLLRLGRMALTSGAAAGLTFGFFLTLPLLQQMGRPPKSNVEVRSVGGALLPPPPPPPAEEEPEEEPPEETPPMELTEESTPPMDLDQLELALAPGFGDGLGGAGALAVGRLTRAGDGDENRDREVESIFSMADLDQPPRVVSQPPPRYPPEMRAARTRGTVYVLFVVNREGRVVNPKVQKSNHPVFDGPALEAVRRWRFEPGKRNGNAVSFRMRVPITFACG